MSSILQALSAEKIEILKKTWLELFTSIHSSEALHARWETSFKLSKEKIPEAITFELFDLAAYDDMDTTLLRFLRARKYNIPETLKMLLEALHWRRQVNVRQIMQDGEEALKKELVDAQMYFIWGQDLTGRPIIFFNVGNFLPTKSAEDTELFKRYLIYNMETARFFVGDNGVMALADLSSFGRKNIDLDFSKVFAEMFQNYYPEILGRAVVVGSGLKMALFEGVWGIAKFFLDVEVRKKISFAKSKELKEYMEPRFIPKSLNGEFNESSIRASAPPHTGAAANAANSSGSLASRQQQLAKMDEFKGTVYGDAGRDAIKSDLRGLWLSMTSTRPPNLYQRLGLLKDGQVDWTRARST